jgi:hypothetical protein
MKLKATLFSAYAKRALPILALAGITMSFSSCKLDNDNYQPEQVAAVSIINAAPILNDIDFVIGTRVVNNTDLVYGSKTDYLSAFAGTRTGAVIEPGTSKNLYNGPFNLEAGYYHSLFILSEGDAISFLTVKDFPNEPSGEKSNVRFINLSADAPAYSLELVGDTTTFNNVAYKAYTRFKDIKPATYTAILKNTATNATVATLQNVEITKQNSYTIWAKGLTNTTVEQRKLSLQLSRHKF